MEEARDDLVLHAVVDGLTEGAGGLEPVHLGGLHAAVAHHAHPLPRLELAGEERGPHRARPVQVHYHLARPRTEGVGEAEKSILIFLGVCL